jgi:putative aldouronate transport system permease protein
MTTKSPVGRSGYGYFKKLFADVCSQRMLYLFLLPAIIFTLVFNYRPIYGVIMAFEKYDIVKGLWGSTFIGLDNFKSFLTDPDFYRALVNTVGLSTLNIIFSFPLPIIFAILLNEFRYTRLKKIVQSITYLPHFLSWVIVAGLLYRLLDQDTGVVNLLIEVFGGEKIGFFREPQYFWGIFTIGSIWKELGWGSILYLSAMTAISQEVYEAATVDGAGRFRRIWHVTLPGIMPTIVLLLILTISSFFSGSGAFEPAYALRNPMVASRSDIIDIFALLIGSVSRLIASS